MSFPSSDANDQPRGWLLWLLRVLLLIVAVPVGYGVFRLQWVVFREWQEKSALQRPDRVQHVLATVTDQRKDEDLDEVRYQFQLPGDPTTYSHTDFTGRTNLWVPLQPGALKSEPISAEDDSAAFPLAASPADESPLVSKPYPAGTSPAPMRKSVDVVYLPENPWANQPAQRAGSPQTDSTVGLIFVVLLCLVPEVGIVVGALALANDRFRRQLVDWWNSPVSTTPKRPSIPCVIVCDRCRKVLERYTEGFGGMMHQLEGVNCPSCRKRLCNNCHPPSRGTTCPTCNGSLRPNFGMYMREW